MNERTDALHHVLLDLQTGHTGDRVTECKHAEVAVADVDRLAGGDEGLHLGSNANLAISRDVDAAHEHRCARCEVRDDLDRYAFNTSVSLATAGYEIDLRPSNTPPYVHTSRPCVVFRLVDLVISWDVKFHAIEVKFALIEDCDVRFIFRH